MYCKDMKESCEVLKSGKARGRFNDKGIKFKPDPKAAELYGQGAEPARNPNRVIKGGPSGFWIS